MEAATGCGFRKIHLSHRRHTLRPQRGDSSRLLIKQYVLCERGSRHKTSAQMQFTLSEASSLRQVPGSGLREEDLGVTDGEKLTLMRHL